MTIGIKVVFTVLPYDPADLCKYFPASWANKILDSENQIENKYAYSGRMQQKCKSKAAVWWQMIKISKKCWKRYALRWPHWWGEWNWSNRKSFKNMLIGVWGFWFWFGLLGLSLVSSHLSLPSCRLILLQARILKDKSEILKIPLLWLKSAG